MAMVHLTKQNFDEEIKTGYTLVDFWAEWCAPCKMIAPVIEELSNEMSDKLKVGKLNTDEEIEVASLYGIQGIPTLILYKDGKPVDRITGAANKAVYSDFLNKHINA